MRSDLPPIRDLLLIAEVFWKAFLEEDGNFNSKFLNVFSCFANLMHGSHFLAFYRGEKAEIDLRIQLFEYLLDKNACLVLVHFKCLKLETRLYLMTWFLSVFSDCFAGELLLQIWDNFLLAVL